MKDQRLKPHSSARSSHLRSGWLIRVLAVLVLFGVFFIGGMNRRARAQTERLVSPFGDDLGGTNDCTSPDQPCKTINQAISVAGAGDLIMLGPGTYNEDVTVSQSVTIQGDLFTGSSINAGATGSALTVNSGITTTIDSLTFTNGSAASGGGISNAGILNLSASTINGNQTTGSGAGIANSGTMMVVNSTISGNAAGGTGGGIDTEGASANTTLVNCTIASNSATSGGGLFTGTGATLNFTNTIVAGSTSGGDCVNNGTGGTNDRNLVQDGSCSPAVSGDPKLGPLQNNGGPTATRAEMSGSPAIDAGDDAVLGAPFNLSMDQRGLDFPRKACAHVDIGAYEFASNSPPTIMCPANITAVTNPGQTTATVSFMATATDLCDGTLTPVYKIGATTITSPFAFPAGVTTVTVSATNSRSLTSMCSFKVTVTLLNGCIQDDHTGDTLRFNSQTGQYVYTRCKDKFTLSGTGVVSNSGGFITLTDNRSDRRISAGFNPGTLTGRATITLILAQGVFQQITINQTNPRATCACP